MANDVLFGRRARLTISIPVATPGDYTHTTSDDIEINGGDDPLRPGLRIQFKIKKSGEKDPNSAEITVTNLSPTRRASLQQKGVKLTLEAGYQSTGLTRIFRGDVRTADHVRDGADWNTVFKCGDGERAYRNARVNESFAPGTGAGAILRTLAERSGLAMGNIPDIALDLQQTYDQGYIATGRWAYEMDRLVKSLGYEWSTQDETLQVLLPDGILGAAIPEISPQSGLIGSPEMGTPDKKTKTALCKFKSLLLPSRPGAKVFVRSERYPGTFVKVKKCEMLGDTHGGDWYTNFEGVILASG